MIVTLSGENSHALHSELARLVTDFAAQHGDMAVERLDGETAGFERLQESLQSAPFFAARKLAVLRAPGAVKRFAENVEQLLQGIPATTDVVVVEPKLDKRSVYYKFLKKATDFREYAELDESGLTRWLVQTAGEQGGSLGAAEARLLIDRIGPVQQLLANEVEKLLLYDSTITRTTIELLTEPAPQSSMFDLLAAAFAGDARTALALYGDQREQRVDPAQIIAMLAWQLRVLALIRTAAGRTSADIAAAAKLSPFVVRKSQPTAARLSLARLKQLVADLLMLDTRSKRENIDLDAALQCYLLSLAA